MPINKESPFGQFLIGETSALCDQVGLEIVKEINGASIEDSSDLEDFFEQNNNEDKDDNSEEKNNAAKDLVSLIYNITYSFVSGGNRPEIIKGNLATTMINNGNTKNMFANRNNVDEKSVAAFTKEAVGEWIENKEKPRVAPDLIPKGAEPLQVGANLHR